MNQKAAQSETGYNKGNTTHYEILSDSLFDFRKADDSTPSNLKDILDNIILKNPHRRVYMVAIGVYSDVKMMTMLTALRAMYHIDNLIMSDVLTAAPTLERHLAGLDYADKVLNVEIIHSLNDLVDVLYEGKFPSIPPNTIRLNPAFHQYRSYYLDKQSVLAYQDTKLKEYLELTSSRAASVFRRVEHMNNILRFAGITFLLITVFAFIWRIFYPEQVSTESLLISGGLGITPLLANFFYNPLASLQRSLNNLVRLRNYMESYSTVTALVRHHLTSPEFLNDPARVNDPDAALERFKAQMALIGDVAEKMSVNFRDISLEAQRDTPEERPLAGGGQFPN